MRLPLPEGTVRGPERRPKVGPSPRAKRVFRREEPSAKPVVVEMDNAARLARIAEEAPPAAPEEAKQPVITQEEVDAARREYAGKMQRLQQLEKSNSFKLATTNTWTLAARKAYASEIRKMILGKDTGSVSTARAPSLEAEFGPPTYSPPTDPVRVKEFEAKMAREIDEERRSAVKKAV